MEDEPELYIVRPPDLGDDWRAERERQRLESRRRHLARLQEALAVADACANDPIERAQAVLDGFFGARDRESGEPCRCGCHPQLPESDQHDYGADCSCRLSKAERTARWDEWQHDMDAYWASPEGREVTARRAAEGAELAAWVAADPGVVVTSRGGAAPEQWRGSVDGHSFYFRERHDHWRIELDLVPCGRFVEVWTGGDLDDKANRPLKELDEGDVIAEGATSEPGYGATPLERGRFIVDTVRTHLQRKDCRTHTDERDGIEGLLGMPMVWCPHCGTRP